MRAVVPVSELGSRMPEAGRIRMGVKTARAMKSITEFRFTSPDEKALHQLSALYGGTVRAWSDPKANPKHQFELLSNADEIDIFLPPDALSIWYEKWTGGGAERRCDGEMCETTQASPDGGDMVMVPCICTEKNKMDCKVYVRLTVIIPQIRFAGGWRLETKGWNAAQELPNMVKFITGLQEGGHITKAKLRISQRTKKSQGKTRNFVVPELAVDDSPEALLQGHSIVQAIEESDVPALPMSANGVNLDVVDAEVIEGSEVPMPSVEEVREQASELAARRGGELSPTEISFQHRCEDLSIFIGAGASMTPTLVSAIARTITKGRTEEPRELSDEEIAKALDRIDEIIQGKAHWGGLDDEGYVKIRKM